MFLCGRQVHAAAKTLAARITPKRWTFINPPNTKKIPEYFLGNPQLRVVSTALRLPLQYVHFKWMQILAKKN
jgi:hypothetical protein